MTGPLAGFRVIELAAFHNGPAAGYMLGDLGADIIKIEPPVTGDPSRGVLSMSNMRMELPGGQNVQFQTSNRNKKSIVLDLTKEKGKGIFYKLVEKSDVFITNYRTRVLHKLGADYETLEKYNPKLIYASNSSYGPDGPWAEKRGFDQASQAFSGIMYAVGRKENTEPQLIAGGLFDQAGATVVAYGILAALLARERMSIGQKLDCSLLGSAVHLQALNVNSQLWRGKSMPRHSRISTPNPMTNYYCCADGKWLLIFEVQSDRYWHDFCQALSIQHLETDPRFISVAARKKNYAKINPVVAEAFAAKTRDEWLSILAPYEFGYTPIYSYADMVADPQVIANQYVVDYDLPVIGKTKVTGFPVRFSKTPAHIYSLVPEFGQNTEEVLIDELGYSWDDIATLKSEGVVP